MLNFLAGWHHWLDGREYEWTPGVGDGQGGLACCDAWARKESDTAEWLNWTDSLCRAFQVVLVVKNAPANAGDIRDAGSIPGSGRSPGGGHDNPLLCCCLENPMDRGAWRTVVHRVAKSWTWLRWLSMHAHMHTPCKQRASSWGTSAVKRKCHFLCHLEESVCLRKKGSYGHVCQKSGMGRKNSR